MRRDAAAKVDEFRGCLRVHAAELSKNVTSLLIGVLDGGAAGDASKDMVMGRDDFVSRVTTIRNIRQKFSPKDVMDVYDEAALELGTKKVTAPALIEYFSNSISKTRSMALKLRGAIQQDFVGITEYRNAFSSITGDDENYAEFNSFADFTEDMLDMDEGTISDADAAALYAFVDKDADGRVSLNDFLEFVVGQSMEAIRGLSTGNENTIVDMTLSAVTMDEELNRLRYAKIAPDMGGKAAPTDPNYGSFGKGVSLWVWRHRQGTAFGRLKPIIDIQLDDSSSYAPLVISGYTCLATPVSSGQYLWIKRATNNEEEKDAIVDLKITIEAKANTGTSPGVGWSRVEGNFAKSMFSSSGATLWFKSLRNRTKNAKLSSLRTGASALSNQTRGAGLMKAAKRVLRNFVPLTAMSELYSNSRGGKSKDDGGEAESKMEKRSDSDFDFTKLYSLYNGEAPYMSSKNFHRILIDAGIRLNSADERLCYSFFDVDQAGYGYLKRKDFVRALVYNDDDLDYVIDKLRMKLLQDRAAMTDKDGHQRNTLRVSRILSHIFKHINSNGDNVMSVKEFTATVAKLGIFLLREEGNCIMKTMDVDGDGRIEEDDFIRFLRSQSLARKRRATRIFDYSQKLKQWLRQGSSASSSSSRNQWAILKQRNEKASGGTFPGHLGPVDLYQLLSAQGVEISYSEACELSLLVTPNQQGIKEVDLDAFMSNHSRNIGELMAILERDIMKEVIDVYRAHRAAARTDGSVDTELNERYAAAVGSVVGRIEASTNVESAAPAAGGAPVPSAESAAKCDVVSVAQLKAGVEAAMGRPPTHGALPNQEEWAIVAVLVGAGRFENDAYGVHAKQFVEGVCSYVAGDLAHAAKGEVVNLDVLCNELRGMIQDEAKLAGNGRGTDYVAVFSSFDRDGGGTIDLDEFSAMLKKLQLVDRLPEKQVPDLLKIFDRHNTGSVTFDDFLYFVESGGKLDDMAPIDEEDEEEDFGLGSNLPPAKITNNPDCDWLLWYMYRQACKIGRRDPEIVISELEANLRNVDSTSPDMGIPAMKLWQVLMDMKLASNMRKSQFDAGMYFLAMDGDGSRDEDPIDYLSLTKYITRMGFAYNALVQERRTVDMKKFSHLLASLKKGLINLDNANSSSVDMTPSAATPSVLIGSHFERILRRQDSNQDGLLTVPEFSQALRRIDVVDARSWTKAMIRKLFEECGNRSDGLLNIMDFGKMVRGDYSGSGGGAFGERTIDELSDDDDDNIFTLQKNTSDTSLFKKVSDVMMDLVPMSRSGGSSPNSLTTHVEAVRSTIYKYFHRFDPSGKGLVSEEQFSKFSLKSGLKTRLRAAELRKLTSKLRKKTSDGFGISVIDYEKLCRMLSPPSDSLPRSRIDAVMNSLQEAARTSALSDRSFITLCSLADPKLSGKISSEEFCIVCKMMGYAIASNELEMFKEAMSESLGGGRADYGDLIDYNQANRLLSAYTPGAQLSSSTFADQDRYRVQHRAENGSLPAYATPGTVTRMPFSPGATTGPGLDTQRSVRTHGGRYVSTPMYHDRGYSATTPASAPRGATSTISGSVEERALATLAGRISNSRYALRLNQPVMSALLRHCEEKDRNNSGYLPESALQAVFEDCDIILTPPDLRAIRTRFARSVVDDDIEYHAMCTFLKDAITSSSSVEGSATSSFLQSPAITRKLATFRADGLDVRKVFQDADYDGHGTVPSTRFAETIRRYALLQSERQLGIAMEEHACVSDRNKINYEDFCDALDMAERASSSRHGVGFGSSTKSAVSGDGYDGVRSSRDRLRSSREATGSEMDGRPPYGAPAQVGRNSYDYN